mgnify:CR=1 FL=1
MEVNATDFENGSYVLVSGILNGEDTPRTILTQIERIDKYEKTITFNGVSFKEINSVDPIKITKENLTKECGFSLSNYSEIYRNGEVIIATHFDKLTQQDFFYLIAHTPSEVNYDNIPDTYKIRVEYVHQLQKIDGCAKEIKF